MRHLSVSALFASIFFLIGSCQQPVADAPIVTPPPPPPPPPPVDTRPYPTLAEQRAALANKNVTTLTRLLDSAQLIGDMQYLTSDACTGRRMGTPGHEAAYSHLLMRMRGAGVDSFGSSMTQTFTGRAVNGTTVGKNIVGVVPGTSFPDQYIVITGHYDHLGKPGTQTFYGADDNASGAAAVVALAKYFKANPHTYTLVFAALDREETGLEGAHGFLAGLTDAERSKVKFNFNMDMIARSDNNEIFACGINRYPAFRYAIDSVQRKTRVHLLMGHDGNATLAPGDDWTNLSDHAAFHQRSIPFIYLGVEDHADYHKPTDTFDKVNKSAYLENANLALLIIRALKP